MKFSTILLLGIAILILINIVTAQPDISQDLFDNEHYIIVGHVYEPYTQDNIVTLINIRTGESIKVTAINCEHGMKEYLFNLANLHQGWTHEDEFILSYGNFSAQFNIIEDLIAYQQDIQRPADIDPIFILSGFLVVAVGSGYFYMKKKKSNQEVTTLANESNTEKVTIAERVVVLIIFGALAGFSAYSGNQEAAAGYASTIAVYFLARQGV